jgi:hypothetical protein
MTQFLCGDLHGSCRVACQQTRNEPERASNRHVLRRGLRHHTRRCGDMVIHRSQLPCAICGDLGATCFRRRLGASERNTANYENRDFADG